MHSHTTPTYWFQILGDPAPQGSKRHLGNGVMVESSRKVKPWRAAVAWEARAAAKGIPVTGPVRAHLDFFLRRPKSAKRNCLQPTTRPDIDKLVRSTLDGLTGGGLFVDDSQVVTLSAEKHYAIDGRHWLELDDPWGWKRAALTVPGAVVYLWRL